VITISGRYPEPGSVFKDCQACPEMVVVPGGTFIMGAPEGEEGRYGAERPQHEVTIQPFAIGRYEVTFVEWDACVAAGKLGCSTEPEARWGRGRQPVINVSWYAAQEYVAWLKEETGEYYRLPSEAKCEYAARAGTTTRYWWGDEITPENANYGDIGKATDVGAYGANVFGLHDTAGNVWEWAEDCWNGSYERAPQNGAAWLEGDCWQRVVRGGSWSNEPGHLRSAMRGGSRPEGGAYDMGFRVARTLTP
jgi:formylglycine-generating enzyme required for sulfatase activity